MDAELSRRHANVRRAAQGAGLDALIVAGSEYTGFDGAVRYLSGFRIVHRYAYVLIPAQGEATILFPSEARYVGEHATAQLDQVFAEHPGAWLGEQVRGRRVGVYGLDHVMAVRDFRALQDAAAEVVPFDVEFDLARAAKSAAELDSVRDSIRINEEGFRVLVGGFEPGKTEAELLAPVEALFVERGCGRSTMNMMLGGEPGPQATEFRLASATRRVGAGELLLPSLEIAGPGGHWVEASRPLGTVDAESEQMLETYCGYFEAASRALAAGKSAHDVHRTVSACFTGSGYELGHVTGHSIGMTMIEHPRIGDGVETELETGMIISMHPHMMSADRNRCFFMQDTWLVGATGGQRLSTLRVKVYGSAEPAG